MAFVCFAGEPSIGLNSVRRECKITHNSVVMCETLNEPVAVEWRALAIRRRVSKQTEYVSEFLPGFIKQLWSLWEDPCICIIVAPIPLPCRPR